VTGGAGAGAAAFRLNAGIAVSITVEPVSPSTVRAVPLDSMKVIFGMVDGCGNGRAGMAAGGFLYNHSSARAIPSLSFEGAATLAA